MGDLRSWSPEPNGVLTEEKLLSSSSSSSLSNHTEIGSACCRRAEEATRGIIDQIQPTVVSQQRRKAVIDYVQRLIRNYLGYEVFPFGSVPLKTYLPDGDIDLTAFGGIHVEEALANDVFSVLESEDKNGSAEFVVKDVQLIRAEVKLVKCLVQNIVVDISFNQLGGLCTLCFLEQVDRLIGKDHLFKRSIIFIKAWCYYESRILGAHHGLISTYALETLVLFIFHLFYSTLNGPLEVLFKFLDYFSKFDWDNFCVSLHGPVRISLLPEIVPEAPDNGGDDLLLGNDFFTNCVDMFSVPARVYEPNMRTFPQKHLNIVDPLKENNNLGRSVSKGNFYRIRSAFTYGARKLGHILSLSEENVEDEVHKFFSNTLDRHGSGQRPDVQDYPSSRYSGLGSAPLFSGIELAEDPTVNKLSEFAYSGDKMAKHNQGHSRDTDLEMTGNKNSSGKATKNEPLGRSATVASSVFPEVNGLKNGTVVSQKDLSGDANELATSKIEPLKSLPSSAEVALSPLGTGIHAPHPFFSHFSKENEELKNGIFDKKHSEKSGFTEKLDMSGPLMKPSEGLGSNAHGKQDGNHLITHQDLRAPAGYYGNGSTNNDEIPATLNSLSDLSGDYDTHLSSLHNGRWCYDYALTAAVPSISPSLLPQSPSKKQWDITQHAMHVKGNPFTQINNNGLLSRPMFFPIGPHIFPSGTSFGLEEVQKPRGTGTYFPNVNHYRERPQSLRIRNQVPVRSPRGNGRVSTLPELNLVEKNNHELTQAHFVHQGGVKFGYSDHTSGSGSPGRKVHHHSNGLVHRVEHTVELGTTGCPQENSRWPSSVSLLSQNLNLNL